MDPAVLCRYVQLPINARMREAWEDRWQTVDVDGVATPKTLMEAAARLGVGVFASAPLQEGSLLKDTALQVGHPHPKGLDKCDCARVEWWHNGALGV